MLDRRVLAGRVHGLQDDEQRLPVTRPQELLRVGELLDAARERFLRTLLDLVLGEVREVRATGPAGVSRREARRLAGLDDELLEQPAPDGCAHDADSDRPGPTSAFVAHLSNIIAITFLRARARSAARASKRLALMRETCTPRAKASSPPRIVHLGESDHQARCTIVVTWVTFATSATC